jgi:hypothetical protein
MDCELDRFDKEGVARLERAGYLRVLADLLRSHRGVRQAVDPGAVRLQVSNAAETAVRCAAPKRGRAGAQ